VVYYTEPKGRKSTIEPPSLPADQALVLLKRQKDKAESLLQQANLPESEISAWCNTTREVLKRTFGSDSRNISEVLSGYTFIMDEDTTEHDLQTWRRQSLDHSIKMLESCLEQLEIFSPQAKDARTPKEPSKTSRKVFVVHGRDESKRESVARFLEKLDLLPIILHEQPSLGGTIIEKLERESDVGSPSLY